MKHMIMGGCWFIAAILAIWFKPGNENIFWYCILLTQIWLATGE